MQIKSQTKRIISMLLIISAFFLYAVTPAMAEVSQLKNNGDKKILQSKSKDKVNKSNKKSTNRFIVKYKENKEKQGKEKITKSIRQNIKYIKKLNRDSKKQNKKQRFDLITTNNKITYEELLQKLQIESKDADIEYIQPDYKISLNANDEYYKQQWALGEVGEGTETVGDTNIALAWEITKGKDVLIAVIDTGIDIEHEDLLQNIWINENEIPGNGIDDDGNGYIDDVNGWNFNEATNAVYKEGSKDENHGTHIAGIIAAVKDNEKGVVGAAPGATIMPLKVFNNGVAYTSDIIEAIEYASDMGAKIVNCSWGGFDENPALREAIEGNDMLFVCAAGNNGLNVETFPLYPGAYDIENVISVASTNRDGRLSVFSNYGEKLVHVGAPGEDIISTLPENNYGELSGTSMAAPFVSGEAALIISTYGNIIPSEIKGKIIESSDKLSSLAGKVYEGNRINGKNAVLGLTGKSISNQEVTDEEDTTEENSQNENSEGENSNDSTTDSENEESADTEEIHQSEKFFDLDDIFADKVVGEILKKRDEYSHAKDEEKGAILENFQIEEDMLIKAENRGYSLVDSIFAASIVKNYGFTLDEIEGLLDIYINLETIYRQLDKFEVLKNEQKLSQEAIIEIKALLLDGYPISKIKSAYEESKTSQEDIKIILENHEKSSDFETLNTGDDEDEPISYEAPFDYRRNSTEYINAGNGSLTYEEVDLSLPGRNGLDLNIITRYQMEDAGTFHYLDNTTNKREGASPYGLGWNLGFSHFYKLNGGRFLRLSTGETYELDYTNIDGIWEIEDYTLNDIVFKNDDESFNNGDEDSKYVLIHKNGKKEYFGREGNILGIVDRYGNTITFEYKSWGENIVIDKITDTLGRSVEISYANYVDSGIRKTIITAPDGSTIELLLEEIPGDYTSGTSIDLYKLIKKTDQEGRETDFRTIIREAIYKVDVSYGKDLVLIDRITYPTGGKSYYDYEKQTARINKDTRFYSEYYRITSRYDYADGVHYNEDTYTYEGDYSAYGISGWDNLKNYIYSTTITNSEGTERTLTFKKYNGNKPSGRKIKEEIKEDGTTLLREINYEYNSDDLLTNEETIAYNPTAGTSMTRDKEWSYDSEKYGDLVEYTDELGNKTTYTYDSNFHQTKSEEGNINESDYQKIAYQIDSSNGNVNKAIKHYMDDEAIRFIETDYTYDSYGNVLSEKTQIEDGKYITKNYEYDSIYQHGYLTKAYTNVEGYDLDSLIKTSETIEETYGFDFETGNQKGYIDGNGKITLYYHDKLGRTKKIQYFDTDDKIEIDYDDEDNIITITDEEGNQRKKIYDKLGRLLKEQEVKDGVWITVLENGYNNLGQISAVRDGEGNITYYLYDALGRQKKVYNPDFSEVNITYDDGENSKTIENEEGDPQKYYYDKLGNLIKEEVKPDKDGATTYTTTYSHDYIGNVTSMVDANGHQTKYDYDNMSRLISVTDPYDKMTKYEYSKQGNLRKITTGLSATGQGYQLSAKGSNSILSLLDDSMMTTQSSTSGHIFFSYADIRDYNSDKLSGIPYDEDGIPFGEERYYSMDVIKHDTDGNEFEIVSARVYDLDELFNTNPTPFENYVYTNEEKSSGIVAYTQRLTEEHNTVMVVFVYEQKDSTASEGSVVTREYDQLGRLIKETDPLNKDVYIDYDKVGNITGKRDKKGQITSFSYDDRNRLLNQNAGDIAINYTYDKAGNIKTMEDETGLTSYTYYENGRLKRQTEPDEKYIEYDYDKSGNMTQITDYFGKVTDYEYDDRNRLKTVTIDGETTTYSYYSDGARENIIYPGAIGTEYIYDGLNNLITLRNVEFSGVINEFSYTYDGVGNQLTKVDANGTTSYTYDKLNRLETVSEPDGSQTTYTFDDNGNIATKDMVHPEDYSFTFKQGGQDKVMNGITSHTINYTNDDSNKLTEITETLDNTGAVSSPYVGPATITVDLDYDENGNLTTTTKGGSADTEISSYKYDQMNQMTEYKSPSSVITSYSYDGKGLRKTKTTGSNTTGFYYSGGNVINEAENGVLKSRNIRGINIIAREDNGGTKAYYLYNGHGDTVNLVTNTGEIVNTYDYDAYGKAKLEEESTDNPYRYAGEYYDKESELYYLRARYYDPNIARFISEDSYKGDAKFPLSLNLYTYSWNNPIKYIDPTGNDPYRQKKMNEARAAANEVDALKEIKAYSDKLNEAYKKRQIDASDMKLTEVSLRAFIKGLDVGTWTAAFDDLNILIQKWKAARAAKKAANETAKTVDINNPVLDNIRTGSALKLDAQHAFDDIIDNYASYADEFDLVGGDGISRKLYQVEGSLNGKEGIFEWIVDPDSTKGVTHRRFIEGVGITGSPNAYPKK
ncbi:S8 family serine peptidase [Wukongibacter sp. M2B1]|uniref:S8 family serine peptidase n=1 Tax=Wukongibacter sp. M2B1 TaxID=3088895 RepID=UPI003D798BAA